MTPRYVTPPETFQPFRRFPMPRSIDDPVMKLGQDRYIVRDADGHALGYLCAAVSVIVSAPAKEAVKSRSL